MNQIAYCIGYILGFAIPILFYFALLGAGAALMVAVFRRCTKKA
jgi:hypothetical protein